MAKKHYLDRDEFHDELTICKKVGKLTDRALAMFQLLATEVSRDFYFEDNEDKKDAVAVAVHDLFKYWGNFKESNVVQFKINRNFTNNEEIIVDIFGHGKIAYKANNGFDIKKGKFQIGTTINNSLKSLVEVVVGRDDKVIAIYVDKIKNKVTLMDKFNSDDLSVKSSVVIRTEPIEVAAVKKLKGNAFRQFDYIPVEEVAEGVEYELKKIHLVEPNKNKDFLFKFKSPPNAFSYFTSIARHGILKSINKINPKQFRNGGKISIDQINRENNGMFNI